MITLFGIFVIWVSSIWVTHTVEAIILFMACLIVDTSCLKEIYVWVMKNMVNVLPLCIKRTLCRHNYIYRDAELLENNETARILALYKRDKERFCIKCGKYEYLDVQCLGLHPPKYIAHWATIKRKPVLTKHKNEWRIL